MENKEDARQSVNIQSGLGRNSMRTTGNAELLSLSEFLDSNPELLLKLAKGYHENALRAGLPVGMSQDEMKSFIDRVSFKNCPWDEVFPVTSRLLNCNNPLGQRCIGCERKGS